MFPYFTSHRSINNNNIKQQLLFLLSSYSLPDSVLSTTSIISLSLLYTLRVKYYPQLQMRDTEKLSKLQSFSQVAHTGSLPPPLLLNTFLYDFLFTVEVQHLFYWSFSFFLCELRVFLLTVFPLACVFFSSSWYLYLTLENPSTHPRVIKVSFISSLIFTFVNI